MKIIPFPGAGEEAPETSAIAALEAAIAGETAPGAETWRALSGDIRSLAPPIDNGFERTLVRRLTEVSEPQAAPTPAAGHGRGRRTRRFPRAVRAPRMLALGGAGALAALLLVLVLVGPLAPAPSRIAEERFPPASSIPSPQASAGAVQSAPAQDVHKALKGDAAPSPALSSPGAARNAPRVQQLGASMTLSGTPSEVQKLADGVGRIAAAEGGYVTNSQVQVESKGTSSATLQLSVPSGRLARILAALGRLGAVRAETQSLQDITGAYDSARRALSDALAERAALLRALAVASTQGQVESLHRRLALAGGAIRRTSAAFAAISASAGNSAVEVTVVGDAQAGGRGLTLERGWHDAGRVLTVALVVLLIGLAGLVPLLALSLTLALAVRTLRRGARERALRGG